MAKKEQKKEVIKFTEPTQHFSLATILWEDRLLFIPEEVGQYLGLKDINAQICQNKEMEYGTYYVLLTGQDLKDFKKVLHGAGIKIDKLRYVPALQLLTEYGFYLLLSRSRKKCGQLFRKWVFTEVIPTIRKTGKYIAAPDETGLMMPPDKTGLVVSRPVSEALPVPAMLSPLIPSTITSLKQLADEAEGAARISRLLKVPEEKVMFKVMEFMEKFHSFKLGEFSGVKAPQAEALYTPTELAKVTGLNDPHAVNELLCRLGLQTAMPDKHGKIVYTPKQTSIDGGYCKKIDFGGRHSDDGEVIWQTKWLAKVIPLLVVKEGI